MAAHRLALDTAGEAWSAPVLGLAAAVSGHVLRSLLSACRFVCHLLLGGVGT